MPIDILYISDFKIGTKENPNWFKVCDQLFRKDSKKLFMLDSTNIRKVHSGKQLESDIYSGLREALFHNARRVFLTLFSSNVDRMKNLLAIAKETNRKVLLHGRSVMQYYDSAIAAGIIEHDDKLVFESYGQIPEERLLVLCTGSQGEPRSSLNRISQGEDKTFKLNSKTDIVVFSSMSIPGNEERIQNLKNRISEKGVPIFDNRNADIHVSGHASRDDLKMIYEYFKPEFILPIHGESQFLEEHLNFCDQLNIKYSPHKVFTGGKILVYEGGIKTKSPERDYESLLFSNARFPCTDQHLSEKKKLARDGVISIAHSKRGKLEINFSGLLISGDEKQNYLYESIRKILQLKIPSEQKIEKVKKSCFSLCGQRPVVFIHQ